MPETEVALDLFLHWLTHAHERRFTVSERSETGAVASDGSTRLTVEIRPLLSVDDAAWVQARKRLEAALSQDLPGAYALWVPSGAALPRDEPALSEFVDLVRRSAVRLGPRERSYIPIPISLYLRKVSDDGGVVSVTGGLNSHWARFTEHVTGSYDLDSTQLHRLPESEDHLPQLLEAIIGHTKALQSGQWVEIDTIDAWTVQKLGDEKGLTVIGGPPAGGEDMALVVRRNLRRLLGEAGPKLRGAETGLRALVLVGHYGRMEQEGATTAMRGYDPVLYAGIDFVCLAADGLVKPIMQPPART
jgi:hypothetical protein